MKRYKKEIYIAIVIGAVACLFCSYIPGLQFLGLAYAFFCGQGYLCWKVKSHTENYQGGYSVQMPDQVGHDNFQTTILEKCKYCKGIAL